MDIEQAIAVCALRMDGYRYMDSLHLRVSAVFDGEVGGKIEGIVEGGSGRVGG
jgi:hypothetical protein